MEFLQMSASFGRIILAHALTFSLNENLKSSRAFVLFHEKICEIFHFINFYEIALWNICSDFQPKLEFKIQHCLWPFSMLKCVKITSFTSFYEIALWNSLKHQPNSEGEFWHMLKLLAQIGIKN